MNPYIATAALVFVVATAPAVAQESASSLPTVRVEEEVLHVFDCDYGSLPTQREVGEWTGQHNFSQVYATRARLMGEVRRACQRDGIDRVRLVREEEAAPAKDAQRVAVILPPFHRHPVKRFTTASPR
jgi:hypothetical protein